MPDSAENGAPEWERLAEKLADAGPTEGDARAWVREVLAQAWDEGFERAEHMARCWGHTDHWGEEDPYPTNPYRAG